jgi:hypothetical protein
MFRNTLLSDSLKHHASAKTQLSKIFFLFFFFFFFFFFFHFTCLCACDGQKHWSRSIVKVQCYAFYCFRHLKIIAPKRSALGTVCDRRESGGGGGGGGGGGEIRSTLHHTVAASNPNATNITGMATITPTLKNPKYETGGKPFATRMSRHIRPASAPTIVRFAEWFDANASAN